MTRFVDFLKLPAYLPNGSAVGQSVQGWLDDGGDLGQDDLTIADGIPTLAFWDPEGPAGTRARIQGSNGRLFVEHAGDGHMGVLGGASTMKTSSEVGLTYSGGWEDYASQSDTYRLYFWKIGTIAFASGLFRNTSLSNSGTHTVATLPANWSPSAGTAIFSGMTNQVGAVEFRIADSGNINLQNGHGLSGNVWFSLAGACWITNTTAL